MIRKIYIFLFLFFYLITSAVSQIGGNYVYQFLKLSPSARATALGGISITMRDYDASLAYSNPAALNAAMDQQIAFNHNFHLAGINNGYVVYARHIEKFQATFHGGIQYVSYGDFQGADEYGEKTNDFQANEYAISFGAGKLIYENLSLGMNTKFIVSHLESYNSLGIAFDLAGMYLSTDQNFGATLLLKNIGGELSPYYEENIEKIPFEIQFGLTKKFKHLPLQLSAIAHNLQRWNLLYDNPYSEEQTLFIGQEETGKSAFEESVENFFRHMIFNAELGLGKNKVFVLRLGYNHFRKKELTVLNYRSLTGFSGGFGIKIRKFRLDYGFGKFHIAGGQNHLSISTSLNHFSKKSIIN